MINNKKIHSLVALLGLVAMLLAFVSFMKPVHAEEYEPSDLIPIGLENLEYELNDIDGTTVSTSAEGKPKILFFFNTGCPRCKAVEKDLTTYGVNTDEVDFVMAESSNGGISRERAIEFYSTDKDSAGVERTSQCYGSVKVCWEYVRSN